MQKLQGLVSQQMTMMATWYQSEQAEKDLSQARREDFSSRPRHRSPADRRCARDGRCWANGGFNLSNT